LTKLNFGAADSYSISFLLFLVVGYFGAYKWSRIYLNEKLSSLVSIAWFSQPIIWYHVKYTALSLGIALLPTYTYIVYKFCYERELDLNRFIIKAFLLMTTFFFSVFMDGYTFVMLTVFSVFCWFFLSMLETDKSINSPLAWFSILKLSLILIFAGISALSYNSYFPGVIDTYIPIDFYRGWGVDVKFLVTPTIGSNLIADITSLGVNRVPSMFFGDSSVYLSSYLLPLLSFSIFGFFKKPNNKLFKYLFFTVAIFSIYMALGPSLKINALRPDFHGSQLMPAEYGILSTGNSFIYQFIPGFKSMRATYRWTALFSFSLWFFYVQMLSTNYLKKRKGLSYIIILIVIVFSIPNISHRLSAQTIYRNQIIEIENVLSPKISEYVENNQVVMFMPVGNSLYANFLASTGNYKTYNVGGDKNVKLAQANWPDKVGIIQEILYNSKKYDIVEISNILGNDVIVIPNFSTNIAEQDASQISICYITFTSSNEYSECISNNKLIEKNKKIILNFYNSELFELFENDMFTIIKNK
jgi:hypothetical protein